MPKVLTDVRQISHVAYGFLLSKALFGALNLELFGHIADGATTVTELNRRTGVSQSSLSTLLSALLSVGLVSREGDTISNSPAAQRYLVPGAPAYFGDYYRFQIDRQIYPQMADLDAGLLGNEAAMRHHSMSEWLADDVSADDFSRAQHVGSAGPAVMMNAALDLSGAQTLLDVAGGTGAYAMEFCRKYPDMTATIIDFPSVIKVADRFVRETGMSDRIALVGGDALATPWPDGQDVVLMSYLLSAVGGDDIAPLLNKARSALNPGGKLLLHDFMLEDDRRGPSAAAGFFLSYLSTRIDPVSFTAAELGDWTRAAGFTDVTSAVMIPEITKIMTAVNPA
jgi:predicted O-methyltransferase YrrM/DNA-binding transcriptional ArsR family regulator